MRSSIGALEVNVRHDVKHAGIILKLANVVDWLQSKYYWIKPCPHCRRKVRLSQKTAISATVSLFCDSVDGA